MSEFDSLRPRKPLTLGSFLLVALAAMVLFVPTFSAHLAVMNAVSIDATVSEVAVSEDGEDLLLSIRVHNPTRSAFTASYGLISGSVDGERVTELGIEVEETTIPSGETKSVPVRVGIEDGYGEEIADAVESGRLDVTGNLEGSIQDAQVEVEVTEGEDDG